MAEIRNIFPANSFKVVAENAGKEITCGLIIGYTDAGSLAVFGGGVIDGKQPVCKDWLWMVETFKTKMIDGDYAQKD